MLAAVCFLASHSALRAAEPGFRELFNGKDLTGWTGDSRFWSFKDGVVTGRTTKEVPAKNNTFLIWTNGTLSDFEMRCSFKLTPGGSDNFANSGIQYRSRVLDPANWVVGGYQADMEAGPTYTGILYEERMTRGIMAARGEKVTWTQDCKKEVTGSLGSGAELQAAIKSGDWNDYVIIAKGNHLQHFINGKQTVDVTDDCEAKRSMDGVVALQIHQGSPMMVEFKNLRYKPLTNDKGDPGDMRAFQGMWKLSAAVAGGNEVPSDDLSQLRVSFMGEDYHLTGGENPSRGKISLDPSHEPKQIEIRPATGPNAGETLHGIYEVTGDTLRICYDAQGGDRPKTFSGKEEGQLSVTCKRTQPEP